MDKQLVMMFGLFLGVLTKTLIIPTLRKYKDNAQFKWDHKYSAAALLTVVLTFIGVLTGFTSEIPQGVSMWDLLSMGFKDGLVWNIVITEVINYSEGPVKGWLGKDK